MADFFTAVERTIARIASRQHGLITTAQLPAAGLSRDMIASRVAKGVLIRVHHGVHRVGHTARCTEADYIAATLACGRGSFLAGRACGHNYRVVGGRPAPPEIVSPGKKDRPKIITRRAMLDPLDVTRYRRIPCLTVPALMVDLAPQLGLDELGEVAQRADAFYDVSVDAIAAVARRRGPFAGIAKLRELYIGDAPILLSELEHRFHAFLVAHAFALATTNRRQEEASSTAAGPSTTSPSNSTATASTAPARPGRTPTNAAAQHTPEATPSAPTRGSTSPKTSRTCSVS